MEVQTAQARRGSVIGPDEEDEAAVDDLTDEDIPGVPRRRRALRLPSSDDEQEDGESAKRSRQYAKPAQEASMKTIAELEVSIDKLRRLKDQGLASEAILKELKEAEKNKNQEIAKLKRAQSLQKAQIKFREKQRTNKKTLAQNAPLPTVGRPRIPNEDALIATISELAVHGSAADGRRRTEIMRACRNLTDLTNVLNESGFNLSRSATYLRLIPARANTREGKLHVKTAPVKLTRAENDLHKSHPDAQFCVASIRNAESIASLLGSSEVAVLSKVNIIKIQRKTFMRKNILFCFIFKLHFWSDSIVG